MIWMSGMVDDRGHAFAVRFRGMAIAVRWRGLDGVRRHGLKDFGPLSFEVALLAGVVGVVANLVWIVWPGAPMGVVIPSRVVGTLLVVVGCLGVVSKATLRKRGVEWYSEVFAQRREMGRCLGCRYRLAGLDVEADGCVVCPECGAAWRVEMAESGER